MLAPLERLARYTRSGLGGLVTLAGLGWATPAIAAEAPDGNSEAESAEGSDGAAEGRADSKPEDSKELAADAVRDKAEADSTPVEERGKTYYFVGARYRMIVVPSFMVKLFADGGKTVAAHSGGAEFGIRKDNFEYNLGLWLASYAMSPTPFKSKTDAEDAWELVESRLKVLYLTADFMWSQPVSKEFAVNYGMGAGLGVVFGDLLRNQAYRTPGGTYAACAGPGNPGGGNYCGNDNNHYNNYSEPSWSSGGSKPIVFPWLAVQGGLRYKPHKKFVGRLDLGFGLTGPFLGVGADYGL